MLIEFLKNKVKSMENQISMTSTNINKKRFCNERRRSEEAFPKRRKNDL